MRVQSVFPYFTDPGHGWCKVSKKLCTELGIINAITNYSYVKGENLYLEEDYDMSTFFNAYEAKYGKKPKLTLMVARLRQSKIRSYDRWVANTAP